jgi:RNA polymerase sigma-70 factor (ECF subfamily)
VRNAELAEDIAQEVFIKVYRFCAYYNPEQAFETWLKAIARNTILDWHRKQKSSRLELGSDEAFEVDSVPCKRPDAEKLLVFRSRKEVLKPSLRKLTGLQRRVLFQRVVRNLSYDEIARKLGLSVSSVKSAMYRAKLVLADAM